MSSNNTNFTSFEASHLSTTIATAVILGLFFVSFVFLLFCRFIFETASRTTSAYSTPDNNPSKDAMRGLEPLIKDMFPTFLYSAVKGCKQGLECAICLSEMEESDVLRLLTVCCHVFHKTCIDEWLETHATCPICRSDLSKPEKEHNMCPLLMFQIKENENDNDTDEVTLTVQGEEWPEEKGTTTEQSNIPKAHSTGHSIVLIKEDYKDDANDKHKLLLTGQVRAEIVKGHRCARSCTVFGNFSSGGDDDKPHRSRGDSIP